MGFFRLLKTGLASSLVSGLTLLTLCLSITQTQAARIEVANGDVAGLIGAIVTANTVDPLGEDTIILAPNGRYALTSAFPDAYAPMTGLPAVTSPISIEGNGAAIVRSSLTEMFRIFMVGSGGDLTLNDLTLEGGYADRGGAIFNANYLTMNNCMLIGNQSDGDGGALLNYNHSSAVLTGCTFSGNQSLSGDGGAVASRESYLEINQSMLADNAALYSGGALHVCTRNETLVGGSTVTGNGAGHDGGGIHNYNDAWLTITNSTVSGNTAGKFGGGIASVNGTLANLTNCSLVDNQAAVGMTVYVAMDNATMHLAGTLIANAPSPVDLCYTDVGMIVGMGNNLATDVTCASDYSGYEELRLGPLAVNGGITLTHALLPGSVAIDYIPPDDATGLPATDQRLVARPLDADNDGNSYYDVGAFEHEPMLVIDIQPKDPRNIVRLSDKHFDVLVPASAVLDPAALKTEDMVGTTILFGTSGAVPTEDLSLPHKLASHLVSGGLLLHFHTAEAGFTMADQQGCLTMHFTDGRAFRGCDRVAVRR